MSESLNTMADDWAILLKPSTRRILNAMLSGATSLTEIADATRMTKSALVPHLKALASLGVVRGERVGTPTGAVARYQLQDASLHISIDASRHAVISWAGRGAWPADVPLVSQIPQPDVREEVAIFLRALREAMGRASDALVIVLYGSAARGEATWKSDIDLLILLDERDPGTEQSVHDAIFAAQMRSQHAFSPTFLDRAEWLVSKKRIVAEAREEGMVVWAPRGENAPWSTLTRYKAITL